MKQQERRKKILERIYFFGEVKNRAYPSSLHLFMLSEPLSVFALYTWTRD